MSEETSEEVRVAFDEWLTDEVAHEEKMEALNDIWDNMTLTSVSRKEDPLLIIEEAEMIQNVENRRTSRIKSVMLWIASSVAACLAIVAFIGWNNPVKSDTTCLITSLDSKGEFLLPDGSVVWLNKGSRLYYEDDLKGQEREVMLEGEGYFDVARDHERPFIVKAGKVSIKVLGTRFTVSAYNDSPVQAYLEEGRILAKVPEHSPVILAPDQAVIYDAEKNVFTTFAENASDHTAWIDGRLEFVNKPLKDIMECLEHWYRIDISCNDLDAASEIRLSMTIRQETIDEICRALTTIADLSYFIDSKGNVKISFDR
jgi:ferric-dicitrate binding protein FerR (iron transport regulator)